MEQETTENIPALEHPLYLLTFFTLERPSWT